LLLKLLARGLVGHRCARLKTMNTLERMVESNEISAHLAASLRLVPR
jgi:hypothetical protein